MGSGRIIFEQGRVPVFDARLNNHGNGPFPGGLQAPFNKRCPRYGDRLGHIDGVGHCQPFFGLNSTAR